MRLCYLSILAVTCLGLAAGGCKRAGGSDGTAPAGDSSDIDIVGKYTYVQKLPAGGTETGTVTVRKDGETYGVAWVRADKVSYSGVGIRRGDQLSVCYSYAGAGERGVAVFAIKPGPRLEGKWAVMGGDGVLYPDTWTAAPSP